MASFELDWLGGVSERYFRRRRSPTVDFPWGTLDPSDYPPVLVNRARSSWTDAAYAEYSTAAAFAEILQALIASRAPIDLIGMAGDFVADEMLHVELASRMAMDLGGGTPLDVDFGDLTHTVAPDASARQRASELIVHTCCVAETFSVPMLVGTMRVTQHPLTRAVLEQIVKDEVPHARLGWLYLDWISEMLDDAERDRLARVALSSLRELAPQWQRLSSRAIDGVTSEGFALEHIYELGWMESQDYREAARTAVVERVARPLRRHGISIPAESIAQLIE